VILPLLDDGNILLIRQFRLATGGFLWELPAGTLARGETALETARRELAEETGYRAASWRKLAQFYPSPGFVDETMTIYLARKMRPGPPRPEEDERIVAQPFAMKELLRLVRAGRIRDGKTLVGLLYFHCLTR
jgi:ADP-ribose pyrophosphatase